MEATYDQAPRDKDRGPTVLILDDEELSRAMLRSACRTALEEGAFRLIETSSIEDAERVLSNEQVHVLLLDKNLGSEDGIESIPRFLSTQPYLQILMVTSSDDLNDVVHAVEFGAFHYFIKGSPPALLVKLIKKGVQLATLVRRAADGATTSRSSARADLLGSSQAMVHFRRQIDAISKIESSILFEGETGTGKSTAVREVHSRRQIYLKQDYRPFVHVNMNALPESLAEREFFGNEKGAFTGAVETQPGYFEQANGGTLFLDEIGDASLALQGKLLTVLDAGEYRRLGGKTMRRSEFHLICATNKNLESLVESGEFRRDLFNRISTIRIKVPTLAERLEDIPQIIESILPGCLERAKLIGKVSIEDIPQDFIENLKHGPNQANIRGLQHQLERLFAFAERDRRGRPILKYWKSIPGLYVRPKEMRGATGAITIDEILKRNLDVVGENKFPGYRGFLDMIRIKLAIDAKRKFSSDRDRAHALKITSARYSQILKSAGLSAKSTEKKSRPDAAARDQVSLKENIL